MSRTYALSVGERLRKIRTQQGMSLHAVERKSGGRWKAVVIGSYERGDRAVSVHKLAEIADFYGVPVHELLPSGPTRGSEQSSRLVLDLAAIRKAPNNQAVGLCRFISAIQERRGDYNGKVLTIRHDDLLALAVVYDVAPQVLVRALVTWGVLPRDTHGIRNSA